MLRLETEQRVVESQESRYDRVLQKKILKKIMIRSQRLGLLTSKVH
jgi:hypothetical protein